MYIHISMFFFHEVCFMNNGGIAFVKLGSKLWMHYTRFLLSAFK